MGKIGVFDSGYGGLTILQSLVQKLPDYDFIYYGDNLRAPYGTRTFKQVYHYTLNAVKELFAMDCPLVILACNTASAKALRSIQQQYVAKYAPEKRVLGVIRPSTELLGTLSKSHHIGLLATNGTVRSDSYRIELERFSPHTVLHQYACSNWVTLIESNTWNTPHGHQEIIQDVENLLAMSDKIDTIILACTHFPIIENFLRNSIPQNIHLISQGEIVASRLVDYLLRHKNIDDLLSKNSNIQYYTTGNPEQFDRQAQQITHVKTASTYRSINNYTH